MRQPEVPAFLLLALTERRGVPLQPVAQVLPSKPAGEAWQVSRLPKLPGSRAEQGLLLAGQLQWLDWPVAGPAPWVFWSRPQPRRPAPGRPEQQHGYYSFDGLRRRQRVKFCPAAKRMHATTNRSGLACVPNWAIARHSRLCPNCRFVPTATLAKSSRVRHIDRKSTRLNSSHVTTSRMPSSA